MTGSRRWFAKHKYQSVECLPVQKCDSGMILKSGITQIHDVQPSLATGKSKAAGIFFFSYGHCWFSSIRSLTMQTGSHFVQHPPSTRNRKAGTALT